MPVSVQTTANTLTNASLFTQVSFGSITPNFGKIDVYADVTQLGASKVIWRLYATTVGISSLIALVGPIASTSPLRLIAGLKAASATTYNLTAELVEPLEQPASFLVIAGMVGYDPLINSPPVTSSSAQQLVYNTAVTFGNIGAYYPNFQVELDLTAAGPKSTSDWNLYATVSGVGGNITALVASQRYNYGPENLARLIIFQAENIGASSYSLVGVGQDSSLTPATPAVTAGLTGVLTHG